MGGAMHVQLWRGEERGQGAANPSHGAARCGAAARIRASHAEHIQGCGMWDVGLIVSMSHGPWAQDSGLASLPTPHLTMREPSRAEPSRSGACSCCSCTSNVQAGEVRVEQSRAEQGDERSQRPERGARGEEASGDVKNLT